MDELCSRFGIPRRHPDPPVDYYGDALADFAGVIGHAMVRTDKSDPAPDPRLWETLVGSRPVAADGFRLARARRQCALLTSCDIEDLFAANMRRIDAMDVAAGSLVKALLMELERRRTYLALAEPAPGAHAIGYEIRQGDLRRRAPRCARTRLPSHHRNHAGGARCVRRHCSSWR